MRCNDTEATPPQGHNHMIGFSGTSLPVESIISDDPCRTAEEETQAELTCVFEGDSHLWSAHRPRVVRVVLLVDRLQMRENRRPLL